LMPIFADEWRQRMIKLSAKLIPGVQFA